jgi:hypothetical protein
VGPGRGDSIRLWRHRSEVRVTWDDGRIAHDVVQKVYPVSSMMLAAFAGSVKIPDFSVMFDDHLVGDRVCSRVLTAALPKRFQSPLFRER